jgi:DNA-binding NarL/FixJ family response regulator
VTALDPADLGQLRAVVRKLQASNSDGTSLAEVVKLARDLEMRSGITVDFEATPELGQPLVVVRMPSGQVVPGASLQALTPREREVAALVADGLSNKQIAGRMRITIGTVKHYVHQILEKTGLASRVAIATHMAPEPRLRGSDTPPIFG